MIYENISDKEQLVLTCIHALISRLVYERYSHSYGVHFMAITKAIIPAAGLGTRLLPMSKAVPKELLPVYDRAAIQWVIEEAVSSGIEEVVLVTNDDKQSIRRYFDRDYTLEHLLELKGDTSNLAKIKRLPEIVDLAFVTQSEQLGLGHAILCAAEILKGETFAVLLPDNIMLEEVPATRQLIEAFDIYRSTVIAVGEIPHSDVCNYGIIAGTKIAEKTFRVADMIEKPNVDEAPSNLAILGRYILTPDIFDILARVKPGSGGEIQLTDGLVSLMALHEIYALEFSGPRHDVGNPLGLLKASIEVALREDGIRDDLATYIKGLS